ncbi:MAG: helix-turn-helix domain-containing protein [Chloroflexi bacterium]|nr:helix-turn-helix domain-containing protein [Chloroflexota bacterium]MBI2982726.1 helix-turn-helix domain-containing protein [Chloroflexota bacterium]
MTDAQRLGEILRQQRERKGITLEQAAEDTRIREKFISALESGDHQALPGAVYTKGFLRNYADYLDLDSTDLVALYTAERVATPEPPRRFEPMRPVMRSGVFISPAILVPVVVLAAVVLFVGYLSYQFASFATPPRIEVLEPAGDTIAQRGEYTVRGRTVPEGRVTVRVFPGPETFPDIRPAADGTFAVTVQLRPGPNHIEVQVLDPAGKVSQVSRAVRLEVAAQATPPTGAELPPQVVVEQPAHSGTYTNSAVPVAGRVERGITSLLVTSSCSSSGATPLAVAADGRFSGSINCPAGTHGIRFVARTASGAESTETRTVAVSFTSAVVIVNVQGGDAWLLVQVDGAPAAGTGRVLANGATQTFTGKQIVIRTGNAGATQVIYNGQLVGKLGDTGQVVEKIYTFQ